ncbi:CobW C-terminal domain-containing protein [Gordoniibacillus kamchatkensis]|uniref:GTP-binding protein n=1 Tax=Gordoniibacillus kamchatkensis TaxID=1590651 RepID=UPI0009E30327
MLFQRSQAFSRVQTVALPVPSLGVLPREQIEQFIHRWKETLLRAKGYLPSSPNGAVQLMQYAGKRLTWTSSPYSGRPYIVFIGLDLNADQLAEDWGRMTGI